ncbi:MAG: hypothetical protein J6Y97_11905 [Prevotella sp.]|nr:hypothetical protein [Prevotella sp.]
MRHFSIRQISIFLLLLFATLFLVPSSAEAQNRTGAKRTKTTVRKPARTAQAPSLRAPSSPTPIDVKERTIKDLLYFPFGCLPHEVSTPEETQEQLVETFGSYEKVNGYEGLHINDTYNFTYCGVPIGLCYADRFEDNRQWYLFYFDTKADADRFYAHIISDIKDAGIPLTKDKIYGGMSNRTRPISIFKWVSVTPPEKVKEADGSNINRTDDVGKYVVELGVYKKVKR